MSQIDVPKVSLSKKIWNLNLDPPKLRKEIKYSILSDIEKVAQENFLFKPQEWVTGITLTGSLVTNQFNDNSDLDINIEISPEILMNFNPRFAFTHPLRLRNIIREMFYKKLNKKKIAGTNFPFQYFIIESGHCLDGDGFYDLINDEWTKGPAYIPLDFEPEESFQKVRADAEDLRREIEHKIADGVGLLWKIKQSQDNCNNFERMNCLIDDFLKIADDLQGLEQYLMDIREYRFGLEKEACVFPAYDLSNDWDIGNIRHKYLKKAGVEEPFRRFIERAKENNLFDLFEKLVYMR